MVLAVQSGPSQGEGMIHALLLTTIISLRLPAPPLRPTTSEELQEQIRQQGDEELGAAIRREFEASERSPRRPPAWRPPPWREEALDLAAQQLGGLSTTDAKTFRRRRQGPCRWQPRPGS